MRIQLLAFRDCEAAGATRALVLRTISSLGVSAVVEEVDLDASDTPRSLRRHGSPTVLVDGDVVGEREACEGRACRLYRDAGDRLIGHPPEPAIRAAIHRAVERERNGMVREA